MGKGTGLPPELSVKFIVWYEDSQSRSEEWIWRDQLMPAPSGFRREPPLLETYPLGNARDFILTNQECSRGLDAIGQIVANLAVSAAFPACQALACKTGARTIRPYNVRVQDTGCYVG